MLVRLQNALGQPNLIEQMVLSAGNSALDTAETRSDSTVNLLIGYNGSPNSQIALDLTLWIAHQTRLASQKQVMVHVVYVVDRRQSPRSEPRFGMASAGRSPQRSRYEKARTHAPTATLTRPEAELSLSSLREHTQGCLTGCLTTPTPAAHNLIEQADCILWQARCLAEEWRGSLEAHLRFGTLAEQLRQVADEKAVDLLVMGCSSPDHALVRQLKKFPCPILGIPAQLEE